MQANKSRFVKTLDLSARKKKEIIAEIQDRTKEKLEKGEISFHAKLRNEICMTIPTKRDEDGEEQAMNLRTLMTRVSLVNSYIQGSKNNEHQTVTIYRPKTALKFRV